MNTHHRRLLAQSDQPGRLELGDQARVSPPRVGGSPAPVLLELLQELRPRRGPLVADELGPEGLHERGGAHLADAEEPLEVAEREQVPVELLLELAGGVGDGEEPTGLGGHRRGPQRRVAAGPAGGGVDGFAGDVGRDSRVLPGRLDGYPSPAGGRTVGIPLSGGRAGQPLEAVWTRPLGRWRGRRPHRYGAARNRRRPEVARTTPNGPQRACACPPSTAADRGSCPEQRRPTCRRRHQNQGVRRRAGGRVGAGCGRITARERNRTEWNVPLSVSETTPEDARHNTRSRSSDGFHPSESERVSSASRRPLHRS